VSPPDSKGKFFNIGRFSVHLIQDGYFRIPGKSLIHKDVKKHPNRLLLGLTCLVIRDNHRIVLADTGLGEKPLGDLVSSYGISLPRKLLTELAALEITPSDVDVVILTHLHWDHVGGSTKLEGNCKYIPTFPNAMYIVQQKEWDWAVSLSEEDRSDYHREDFYPLWENNQLRLVQGTEEVVPGIKVELTGGHSPGHQIVWIQDESETALFLADLVPTLKLLDLNWVMRYDQNQEQITKIKHDVLERAVKDSAIAIFQHAPRIRIGTLKRNNRGRIELNNYQIN
jgi:glyoxylase-like metal-dependent hydrolase (beta-lactamase superfamily II)